MTFYLFTFSQMKLIQYSVCCFESAFTYNFVHTPDAKLTIPSQVCYSQLSQMMAIWIRRLFWIFLRQVFIQFNNIERDTVAKNMQHAVCIVDRIVPGTLKKAFTFFMIDLLVESFYQVIFPLTFSNPEPCRAAKLARMTCPLRKKLFLKSWRIHNNKSPSRLLCT